VTTTTLRLVIGDCNVYLPWSRRSLLHQVAVRRVYLGEGLEPRQP
jgi:hypothetical protein